MDVWQIRVRVLFEIPHTLLQELHNDHSCHSPLIGHCKIKSTLLMSIMTITTTFTHLCHHPIEPTHLHQHLPTAYQEKKMCSSKPVLCCTQCNPAAPQRNQSHHLLVPGLSNIWTYSESHHRKSHCNWRLPSSWTTLRVLGSQNFHTVSTLSACENLRIIWQFRKINLVKFNSTYELVNFAIL